MSKKGGVVALREEEQSIDRGSSAAAHIVLASRLEQVAKRIFDTAAAATGLVLFSPLLLIAFIAIKLDSYGPAVVRENRYGYKNRPIKVLKFRLVEACAESDRTNSRLTRVDRILSQTGIDELPRLVNVLRGEMSIFGPPPSPHPKALLNRVKPGVTRWGQVVATREKPPYGDPY